MHFVLELIQNADDNTYKLELIEPTLVFLIESNKITLFNNEVGFSSPHINAICDVKASTKGKHQRGYIGRKGIGFKSVFTVTDRPEIHSNGYHLQFNLNNGHIGYILPNWIDEAERLEHFKNLTETVKDKIQSASISFTDLIQVNKVGEFNTCIHLPLKSESEMQMHKSSLLTNNFNDIKPYLLLFLNRLRNLVIINQSPNASTASQSETVFHREDLDDNLVAIKSNQVDTDTSSSYWLVVRECLPVPDNLKPNEDVESTDLCFAFPLDSFLSGSSQRQMSKLDVFAYLPLRTFGFKFIIQADFVVPASRQDINQDSDWNQWIVKQIPSLFVKSLRQFTTHKILNKREHEKETFHSLRAFIQFIPLEEEIIGFFQHIPRQVCDLLRNEEFLPAVDLVENDTEPVTVWKRPFECVMTKDDLIRQVLTSDLLKKHLGRYYLHPNLLANGEINTKLLANLGVHVLNLSDIVEILKTVFTRSLHEELNDVKLTAKWLVVLQHCLTGSYYSLQQEDKFLKQIKDIPFIPIQRYDYNSKTLVKEMVSLNKCTVFFPLASAQETDQKSVQTSKFNSKLQDLLETDLNLLDTQSLLCLDQLKNAQIVSLLKNMGIKQIEPAELIENHILKVFTDESLLTPRLESATDSDILLLYLIYMNENYQFVQFNINRLRELVLVKTNFGFKRANQSSESIYLTSTYGNKYDLKSMFPTFTNWCLVDPIYLNKTLELTKTQSNATENKSKNKKSKANVEIETISKDQLMLSWRKFFVALGLNDIFVPKLKQTKTKSAINNCENIQIKENESYLFKDYECEITRFYLDLAEKETDLSSGSLLKELTNLFRLIEENWQNSSFSPKPLNSYRYMSAYVVSDDDSNMRPIKDTMDESDYFNTLKSKKWIPVENHKYILNSLTNRVELKSETSLDYPCNVFIKEQVFLHLYGFNVPYAVNLPFHKEKMSFSRELNFRFEFSTSEFLKELHKWCTTNSTCFFSTINQMKNIYLYLGNFLN
jgi:hypothetical protein